MDKQKQLDELIATTEQAIVVLNQIKKFYMHNGFEADPMYCVVCKIDSLIRDFTMGFDELKRRRFEKFVK